ncbi:hypothetical protein C8R42DRAFT_692681 [Lentinula raphanica]|nr:hypothetical protein C8R42DRAFT_692681 [Lentinula raphanica]
MGVGRASHYRIWRPRFLPPLIIAKDSSPYPLLHHSSVWPANPTPAIAFKTCKPPVLARMLNAAFRAYASKALSLWRELFGQRLIGVWRC